MTLKYDHLIGRRFVFGQHDCFGLVRDFYKDNFDKDITNYARPNLFWEKGLNLYMENFYSEGFRVVDEHPSQWRPGDVILMSINAHVANHSAIIVEDGRILHHMIDSLSKVDPYAGVYRNNTVGVFRHMFVDYRPQAKLVDLMEFLPDALQERLLAVQTRGREGEGGLHPENE